MAKTIKLQKIDIKKLDTRQLLSENISYSGLVGFAIGFSFCWAIAFNEMLSTKLSTIVISILFLSLIVFAGVKIVDKNSLELKERFKLK